VLLLLLLPSLDSITEGKKDEEEEGSQQQQQQQQQSQQQQSLNQQLGKLFLNGRTDGSKKKLCNSVVGSYNASCRCTNQSRAAYI
jgi:hypothetical protein